MISYYNVQLYMSILREINETREKHRAYRHSEETKEKLRKPKIKE